MPKDGFLTAKAVANRIKAKGLQKLRWYCQMCQKQCRDENGFKCHLMSESHQRQMGLFAEDPQKYVGEYSREFEKDFVEILRRRGTTKRVKANTIYQEMVGDRHHTHMNSTKWETLSAFVMYLGKSGQAVVEETEKGWYLRYIDRDPAAMARQAALNAREGAALDAEERAARTIEKQIALAAAAAAAGVGDAGTIAPTELKREETKPLTFSLASSLPAAAVAPGDTTADSTTNTDATSTTSSAAAASSTTGTLTLSTATTKPKLANVFGNGDNSNGSNDNSGVITKSAISSSAGRAGITMQVKRKMSALDSVMEENERVKEAKVARAIREGKERVERAREEKERKERDGDTATTTDNIRLDYWLTEGIVVKVMNKTLADGKYYKAKGVITRVHDRYVAELKMLDTNHVLKIDQADLETVIPALDHDVRMVNGAYRGDRAILRSLNTAKFSVTVEIASGSRRGKIVDHVPYEDICKIHSA